MELNKNHIESPEGLEQKQHPPGAETGFDREAAIKGLDRHKFASTTKEGGETDIKPPSARKELEFGDARFDAEAEKTGRKDAVGNDSGGPPKTPETPENPDARESEISSKFSRENFKVENSFDARAKAEYPELNDLKSKCVYDVQPMGTPKAEIDRTPKGEYSSEERDYIKGIRDGIDAPNENTVMQKVIGVDTGKIEKDLDLYLNPRDFNGVSCEAHVAGYVAKAEDATPFTQTPQECYDNLRLDYSNTPYIDPDQSVYVVRYTNGTNYYIPYTKEFDGDVKLEAPMTGCAFTGSENYVIPENKVLPVDNKGAIVTDGEIYRINPDGSEEKVAYYDKDLKRFVLSEEED